MKSAVEVPDKVRENETSAPKCDVILRPNPSSLFLPHDRPGNLEMSVGTRINDVNRKARRLRRGQTRKNQLASVQFRPPFYRGKWGGGPSGHSLTVICLGEGPGAMLTSG